MHSPLAGPVGGGAIWSLSTMLSFPGHQFVLHTLIGAVTILLARLICRQLARDLDLPWAERERLRKSEAQDEEQAGTEIETRAERRHVCDASGHSYTGVNVEDVAQFSSQV